MSQVDVVVVNWNSGSLLRDCIESLDTVKNSLVRHVVIVDNKSSDGSVDFAADYPSVELIRANVNLGFAAACNVGAKRLNNSKYILFLNPDASLFSDTLLKVISYMEDAKNSKVGICGVQLLDSRGQISRSCSRFPTARGFLAQSIGMDRIVSKFGHSMKEWDHLQIREVDQVIGAFFFVRGFLFNDLSGFDERFFVYFEEVDFSYRAVLNGWTSSYLANVSAFHLGGGTSDQVKAHRLYYSLRSRVLYCQKHFSFYSSLLVWLCTLLVEPISRVSFAILHRSWSGVSETLRAYGMLWRWIPRWIWQGETR